MMMEVPNQTPAQSEMPENSELKPSLMDLLTEYGCMESIPDDKLIKIGYARVIEGDLKRIAKIEILNEDETSWKEKVKAKPFGVIEVGLSEMGSFLKIEGREKIGRISDAIDNFGYLPEKESAFLEILPEPRAIHAFSASFRDYLQTLKIKKYEADYLDGLFTGIGYRVLHEYQRKWDRNRKIFRECVKYDPDEYVDYISRDMAKELFNELEKTKGLFTDVSEIGKEVDRREFSRNWSLMFEKDKDDFFEDNHEFSPEFRKISDSIKNKGNNSIIWLLQDFLMQRFPDIIKNGTKFDSNRNLAKFLKNIDRRELTSFKKKDEAKKALNKASPDQKKDFSVDYRKALIEYERDVKILAGAIEFLSPETLLADYFRRKISKIQKMLVSSKSERHNAKFFLDGTPVPELDRNTGIISGDCTADRPLPFREPSIPIFNVKFLNREKKHIGNIYLLKKNR